MSEALNVDLSTNIIDIFTGETWSEKQQKRFVRLAPEIDGMEMLYTNEQNPNKLFTLKILCWGLRENGEIDGLVPWLDKIVPCTEIDDPLQGTWQGYYDPGIEQIFFEAPEHKVSELDAAADYYQYEVENEDDVIQEISDNIGTHAVLSGDQFQSITLAEVVSWRLKANGDMSAMLIDEKLVETTPVLPGDPCLFSANEREDFQYFFQHHIANKLKEKDPEAIAAIASLMNNGAQ
ncbi:MAG: hypothetical protein HOL48_00560 [Porticoccaceae bacterium]|nr:hypothetical protein [Porticoccaceae bacterium]